MSPRIACACVLAGALALVAAAGDARAERMPVRRYTTADGLANARVYRAARDARGFLWFATQDGLSRFDGDRFVSFGVADGLPAQTCQDVAQTPDGALWVGTVRGLARLDLEARQDRPRFTPVPIGDGDVVICRLFVDHAGQLWVGTESGLWRVDRDGRATLVPLWKTRQGHAYAMAEDRDHTMWLATSGGLVHRYADGHTDHTRFSTSEVSDFRVDDLVFDHEGRLWIGAVAPGLVVLRPPAPGTALLPDGGDLMAAGQRRPNRTATGDVRLPDSPGDVVSFPPGDFPGTSIRRHLLVTADDTVWIGSPQVIRFDGHRLVMLGGSDDLPEFNLAPLLEDTAGNLWLGGSTTGLVRITRAGLVAYGQGDGLLGPEVFGFAEDAAGLYAISSWAGHVIDRLDGHRFTAIRPKPPTGQLDVGAWGWNQIGFPDRDGRWWFATGEGVLHYPKVALEALPTTEPDFFGPADGLPGRDVFRLFGDSRGDVWIATMSASGVARWDHATNRVAPLTGAAMPDGTVQAFAEDARGAIWLGSSSGQVVRLPDGRLDGARALAGVADAEVQALHFDRAGRLWIATMDGVVRVDQPDADQPALIHYSAATGLATDQTRVLTEDDHGRIYVGTLHGVDRIDPDRGQIAHYGTADGLPDDYIHAAFRDHLGQLWFGTSNGVGRLLPDEPGPPAPPPVYFTAIEVAGRARPLALDGERAPPALELAHDGGQLAITFTSPSFVVGTPIEFQVRLDGADHDWSAPTRSREVHYAHLAPGTYRFSVRALYQGGPPSAPATLAIVVLPPIWQRPWFVALAAALLALAGWWLYRRRVEQLLAIERVRTRIATDLHDDLGSSLSRIAILSEVATRKTAGGADAGEVIGDIGTSARALVDVASDIVWSTDPKRDDLGSLLVRLRSFAGDVLEGRGLAWSLDAPADPDRIKLGPDQRRHLYLVVKEAIANAARHSDAAHVTISIAPRGGGLEAIVQDDGRGLDPARPGGGNGLGNMRARAEAAGGTLVIDDAPGGGTRITLRLPQRA